MVCDLEKKLFKFSGQGYILGTEICLQNISDIELQLPLHFAILQNYTLSGDVSCCATEHRTI